jgi:hypothetical protein
MGKKMFYFVVSLGMTLNDKLNEVPSNMINTFTRAKNVLKNIHYTHLKKLILKSPENIVPAINLASSNFLEYFGKYNESKYLKVGK